MKFVVRTNPFAVRKRWRRGPTPILASAQPRACFWLRLPWLLLLLLATRAGAQAVSSTPAPAPAVATPTSTPRPTGTPSPATLPSVVPAPPSRVLPDAFPSAPALTDPNRVTLPGPVVASTPTPAPTARPTPTSISVPAAPPVPQAGDVSGQEEPGNNYSLDSPGGLIYDMERGLALAQGQVTFRYRNFTVTGDRGVIDTNTNRALLSGNLTVVAGYNGQSQTFTGKSLVFNLDTGKWTLSKLETQFPPEFFPPGTVLSPIYVHNGTVTGQDEQARGENFRFTSCDRDHYYLRSKRLDFSRLPNGDPQRIVLRRNALFILGREILPLPVYVISLTGQASRRQPLQFTYGQNPTDGYFVRTLYNLRATSKFSDSLLVDALSKRGLGLGLQREILGGGLLYLYAVSKGGNAREIDSRFNKNFRLSSTVSGTARFESSQNNSLTGLGISSQTRGFTLARADGNTRSNLSYNLNSSSFQSSNSTSQSLSLAHTQNFGDGFSLNLNSQLNQSQFGSPGTLATTNATGDLNVQVGKTGRAFDAFLRTELHQDFEQKRSYQLERLPEFLLQSSTSRINVPLLRSVLPGDFTLGVGTFNEPTYGNTNSIYGGEKTRADFFYNARERRAQLLGGPKSGSLLSVQGQFEQAFYSDNTARYNYAYNANLSNTLGPFQLAFNYQKRKTFGFTPFQFDATFPSETLDYTASYTPGQNFRLNLSGGRDIGNRVTRDVLANAQWIPTSGAYFSVGTSFRLQNQYGASKNTFGDILFNARLSRKQTQFLGGQFSLGVRYTPSGQNAGLNRVNAAFDTNVTRKFRLQVLAGYDGLNKRFDFQQYRLITDLHCFNLYTTYDGSTHELRFDLALKAFPFADTRFGRNNYSENFDPSVGEVR